MIDIVSDAVVELDGRGLTLHRPVPARERALGVDLYCDDRHVWSTTIAGGQAAPVFVAWPRPLAGFLEGVARFRVEADGEVLYDRETRFGTADKRIEFVDRAGIPIMIDKWGLMQRPFTGRGPEVIDRMVEVTEDMVRILREECDVHAWIAFGTLLGAAREGGVIGHDSDIDLAYVSRHTTPAAMARELFTITRVLRRHGLRVLVKSGSFITVLFEAADGGNASIDLYTCFYVGDLLHETATVRAPVPRSAIEPLGEIAFEGRMLPAPADPEALLAASYGPGWRTPDPSFRHQPGPDIARRFDGWFGSTMRQRREWERTLRRERAEEDLAPSTLARELGERWTTPRTVVDIGCGRGADALHLAGRGHRVVGLDYARGVTRAAARRARAEDLPASFAGTNLLVLRDVLTRAAELTRTDPRPDTVLARDVLPALHPDAWENFWRLTGLLLRGGGVAHIENVRGPALTDGGARRREVSAEALVAAARRAGAATVVREPDDTSGEEPAERWILTWNRREDR